MVLNGGGSGRRIESESGFDMDISDDTAQLVTVGGDSMASQVLEITSPQSHSTDPLPADRKGKRKLQGVDIMVPSEKRTGPIKKVSSSSGSQRNNILVEYSSSICTVNQVKRVLETAAISASDYDFLIPSEDQRANNAPREYMTVYMWQIKAGLRFPMHSLVHAVCRVMDISPSQLSPIAHNMIVGFILCAQFYKIPLTTDYFFSLFKVQSSPTKGVYFRQTKGHRFLTSLPSIKSEWKEEFFFLRPRSNSWNCRTEWNETYLRPLSNASLARSAVNLGITTHHFGLTKLLNKEILVHGGIQPGVVASSALELRSSMNKIKVLPNGKSTDGRTTQRSENPARVSLASTSTVFAADNPSTALIEEQVLEPMHMDEECYQKLEMVMQQITPELNSTKSQVQALELEVSESLSVQSENRTSLERENVKSIEEGLKKYKADLEIHGDSIRRYAIETYKSPSQEFPDNIEEIQKKAIDNFKSSSEFLDILDQTRKDAVEVYKSSKEFQDFRDDTTKEAIDVYRDSEAPFTYSHDMPPAILPYVKGCTNVEADGNCGFRALGLCIYGGENTWDQVRMDIIEEMTTYAHLYRKFLAGDYGYNAAINQLQHFEGPCLSDKYISFLDHGLAVATKYQVIVHVFWRRSSTTYLPLEWRNDEDDEYPDPPNEEWAVGIVNDNHFVRLYMKPGHPISALSPQWKRHKEHRLSHWMDLYRPRVTAFRHLSNM